MPRSTNLSASAPTTIQPNSVHSPSLQRNTNKQNVVRPRSAAATKEPPKVKQQCEAPTKNQCTPKPMAHPPRHQQQPQQQQHHHHGKQQQSQPHLLQPTASGKQRFFCSPLEIGRKACALSPHLSPIGRKSPVWFIQYPDGKVYLLNDNKVVAEQPPSDAKQQNTKTAMATKPAMIREEHKASSTVETIDSGVIDLSMGQRNRRHNVAQTKPRKHTDVDRFSPPQPAADGRQKRFVISVQPPKAGHRRRTVGVPTAARMGDAKTPLENSFEQILSKSLTPNLNRSAARPASHLDDNLNVGNILDANGLGELIKVFEREEIDLEVFMIMTDADLESIGVAAKERKQILAIIKSMDGSAA